MPGRGKRLAGAVLVFAAVTAASGEIPPRAEAAMSASEEIIAFIKEHEGFKSRVYWDGGSAYIGYGTICRSTDYPNGISEQKADELMREALQAKAESVERFLDKYGITVSQNEFDALLSLTYNVGTAWMNTSTRLFSVLAAGAGGRSDIDVVNAFGTWCHVGKDVSDKLVSRRISEAKIFLYGDYAGSDTRSYRYVVYDPGEGSIEHSMMFYEYGMPYGSLQEAKRDGYRLAGWCTPAGARLSASDVALENLTVSAVWEKADGVQPVRYSDVAEADWFFQYVSELGKSGILRGFDDGTFRPYRTVTWGEALKLALLAVGFDEQPPSGGHWAGGYLSLAVSKGIVGADAVPSLDAPITRRQVAEVAAKSLGLPPLAPEPTFKDTDDGFVLALYHCGIINGVGESGALMFRPDDTITRAEMSAVVWRIANSPIVSADMA